MVYFWITLERAPSNPGDIVAINDKQVAFRLPAEMVDELDRKAEKMSSSVPGVRITRADIVRTLLVQGLGITANQDAIVPPTTHSPMTHSAPPERSAAPEASSLSMDED